MSYFDKPYWWDNNLAWLQRQPELWSRGKLAFVYREMVGDSGREMYRRLERLLPTPEHFCAVDHDPMCLLRHAIAGAPFALVHGDFYQTSLRALEATDGPRVGILNFDTTDATRREWFVRHGSTLRQIVDRGSAGCPAFTVIMNHVLNMGIAEGGGIRENIRRHGEEITRTFDGWIPRRLFPAFTDVGDRYDHAALPSRIGAYDLYRSKGGDGRDNVAVMITVRLTFRRSRGRASFDMAQ